MMIIRVLLAMPSVCRFPNWSEVWVLHDELETCKKLVNFFGFFAVVFFFCFSSTFFFSLKWHNWASYIKTLVLMSRSGSIIGAKSRSQLTNRKWAKREARSPLFFIALFSFWFFFFIFVLFSFSSWSNLLIRPYYSYFPFFCFLFIFLIFFLLYVYMLSLLFTREIYLSMTLQLSRENL